MVFLPYSEHTIQDVELPAQVVFHRLAILNLESVTRSRNGKSMRCLAAHSFGWRRRTGDPYGICIHAVIYRTAEKPC